jgi:hypothetical protein
MRALDGTGLAKRGARSRSGAARRGPLAAALTALLMLGCLLGLAATASAAPWTYQARPYWRGWPCSSLS